MSSWTDSRCGKRVPYGRAEHCDADGCHQTFPSSYLGDAHRTGRHDGVRGCLTVAEMQAKGWRLKTRADGCEVWAGPAMSEEALARMSWNANPAECVKDSSHFRGWAGTSGPDGGADALWVET